MESSKLERVWCKTFYLEFYLFNTEKIYQLIFMISIKDLVLRDKTLDNRFKYIHNYHPHQQNC